MIMIELFDICVSSYGAYGQDISCNRNIVIAKKYQDAVNCNIDLQLYANTRIKSVKIESSTLLM